MTKRPLTDEKIWGEVGGMTVRKIVAEWLKCHGYDGLYAPGSCACRVDDLMPCDDACESCIAGYEQMCPGPELCPVEGNCDFHIGPKNN